MSARRRAPGRPTSARAISVLTAAVLVAGPLAACSGSDSGGEAAGTGSANPSTTAADTSATSSSPSPGSSSSASPSAPGPALPVGDGTLTPQVLQRLGKSSYSDAEMATAAKGTWKGTQVGALSQGEDVSLLVKQGSTWKVVGGWWPSKGAPGPYLGDKRFVLALGSDARPGQDVQRSRADTIQVIGLDGHGGGGILGMPRDSYVPLPGGSRGKINGAMSAAGPQGMTSTVARTTGLPLQGYLLTSMTGLTAAVNAIGGVPVTLKRQVKDVPAGTHNLNGLQALHLARERKSLPGGDFDRSANQGLLLMSGFLKVRGEGVRTLPRIMTAIDKHVTTDLTPTQVLTFLASAYQLNPSRIGRTVAHDGATTIGGASVVQVGPRARAEFARFRDGNL
ncbi:LCP family protein [Luteipulveratus sp. YIM 133132]|uniref:LCP family protein n=1 Tax=Luteipulveratus flavus TaxID=3031728 RepID=UPI0023AF2878|nr:LCP family protein [Luteipulveratus sp. YIM 133132]MDE9364962.1 LCP family protein [Luteipulveratus sp. YIM 133132]